MSMLRLAERVMGEGDVHRLGEHVARAGYELSRYHEVTVGAGEMQDAGEVVEGHLHATPDVLEPLLGTSAPITLYLDDGRVVSLYVLNADGMVTGADGQGFQPPPSG
jgi:hypothetical protein